MDEPPLPLCERAQDSKDPFDPNNFSILSNMDPTDSDDYSDLTDNFEEFHTTSFLRTYAVPGKKYLSKLEADWKTVEAFTDNFKKAMADVRKELNLNDAIFDESEEIKRAFETYQPIKLNKTIKIPEEDQIQIETDMSGSTDSEESKTWLLLKIKQDENDSFKISPVGYDAFKSDDKDLLEMPDISWNQVNSGRNKCEEWLNKFVL